MVCLSHAIRENKTNTNRRILLRRVIHIDFIAMISSRTNERSVLSIMYFSLTYHYFSWQ